jgi:hypothetical protein
MIYCKDHFGKKFIMKNSHGEKGLITLDFDKAKKKGFGVFSYQISGTYVEKGMGSEFCEK